MSNEGDRKRPVRRGSAALLALVGSALLGLAAARFAEIDAAGRLASGDSTPERIGWFVGIGVFLLVAAMSADRRR
jgi:hypothetical protein